MKRAYYGLMLLPLPALGLAACPSFGVDYCIGDACGPTDASMADEQVVPVGCDPTKDPKDSPACVDDSIGIFVSASGSDSNAGTKSSPIKTIGVALTKTDGQHDRVYVCDGTYPETVKLTGPAKIYGGFACTDWSSEGTQPPPLQKVGPTSPGYALDIEGASGEVIIEDLEFDAPAGVAPGESSIAVFVSQSTNVLLRRVTAHAGDGAAGADAVATSNYDADAGADLGGNSGSGDTGGAPKDCSSACGNGVGSIGGKGGNGDVAPPAIDGQDGGPLLPPNPDGSHNGAGGSNSGSCTNGNIGAFAPDADGGVQGGLAGSLQADAGWVRIDGKPGFAGSPGQGGGGGAGTLTGGTSNGGGGGGGCGGCGGAGGGGGGTGGSSLAVLSYQSSTTLDGCSLQTGAGGVGKAGAQGQVGQAGGLYGNQTSGGSACRGGAGGTGGNGAGGGGGGGGNSIAIGYVGTKPTVTGGSMLEGSAGTHGNGGPGAVGVGTNDGNPGADGIKADLQELQ